MLSVANKHQAQYQTQGYRQGLAGVFRYVFILLVALSPSLAGADDSTQLIRAIENTREAVVKITVTRNSKQNKDAESADIQKEFKQNFPQIFNETGRRARLSGAGLIYDSSGLIISSAHLLKNTRKIRVELYSKKSLKARLIGIDERRDIALLKVELNAPPQLPKTASAQSLQVGQPVYAIGAPFGFAGSVTTGIISALREQSKFLKGAAVIQTDVAVNPGNSGGALFNYAGEVIGITNQIISTNGGFQGVSFAVSMDDVVKSVSYIQRNAEKENTR